MILIDRCRVVATMDDAGTELENGSILIDGGAIAWVGQGRPPVKEQPDTIDGTGLVAIPGLINTHHHLYQSLTRVRAQEGGLFDWLRELYPVWATIDADWERTAAEVGLAELALSGCSTTTQTVVVLDPLPKVLSSSISPLLVGTGQTVTLPTTIPGHQVTASATSRIGGAHVDTDNVAVNACDLPVLSRS